MLPNVSETTRGKVPFHAHHGSTHDLQPVHLDLLSVIQLHLSSLNVESPYLITAVVVPQMTLDRCFALDLGRQSLGDGAVELVEYSNGQERVDVAGLDKGV